MKIEFKEIFNEAKALVKKLKTQVTRERITKNRKVELIQKQIRWKCITVPNYDVLSVFRFL